MYTNEPARTYHPRIVITVRRVWRRLWLVEKPGRLHFLAERDKVRLFALFQAPFLVRPERPRGADSGLNLVDDEESAVLASDQAELPEKVIRGVLVASLGQDRLDDDGRDRFRRFATGWRAVSDRRAVFERSHCPTNLSTRILSYCSKHLCSSCSFASTFSSKGYFNCGKSAPGQSYAGISSCEPRPVSLQPYMGVFTANSPCEWPCCGSRSSYLACARGTRP